MVLTLWHELQAAGNWPQCAKIAITGLIYDIIGLRRAFAPIGKVWFMMTRRERVLRAIEFRGPDRAPFFAYAPGVSDIFAMTIMPARDWQPDDPYYPNVYPEAYFIGGWKYKKPMPRDLMAEGRERQDEFGCVWKSPVGPGIGEVVGHPLARWEDLESFPLPDPHAPGRLERFALYKKLLAGDSFVLGNLENGIWERSHFLRGFSNMLMDTVAEPEKAGRLADRLLDEWLIPLVDRYADAGAHGVIMTDDWGMQQGLLIRPDTWRAIYKPRYATLFEAAHRRGMKFFLHTCGDIRDIMDDFLEVGLDVFQKDDIAFMDLEEIADRFGGRACFMGPLDMQRTLPGADREKIYSETRRLLRLLARGGGYIGMFYGQPGAVNITWAQQLTMFAAFRRYGRAQ